MSELENFMDIIEAQAGKPYVWGSDGPESFDCSGLGVFGLRGIGRLGPREDRHSSALIGMTTTISIEEALQTRGAFLYMPGHIAYSRGDGSTIEARNPEVGTGFFDAHGRGWTRAGIIDWKDTPMAWSGKMASPVKGRVSCEWRGYTGHSGIDIAAPTGTPVYAAYAGTVEKAGTAVVSGRSGKGIVIRNADREAQYYGHLNSISVAVGQPVDQGQLIGYSGATGNVTGPHLHFEIWIKNGAGRVNQDTNPRAHFNAHGVVPGSTTGQSTAQDTSTLYTRAIDGDFSGHSVKSLQAWLTRRKYYDRQIDGVMGVETWRAVQRWLTKDGYYNRAVDGIVGPYTILGVQKALQNAGYYRGYALDGDFGVQTKKAWQTYLSKHL